MKKITLKQRRFLIVWVCINAFALFVNMAHIKGHIQDHKSEHYDVDFKRDINGKWDAQHLVFDTISHTPEQIGINLFTNGFGIDEDYSIFHPDEFYPFTTRFFKTELIGSDKSKKLAFLGVFNHYSYLEFIVYILLGLAIIYSPKLWRGEEVKKVPEISEATIAKTPDRARLPLIIIAIIVLICWLLSYFK